MQNRRPEDHEDHQHRPTLSPPTREGSRITPTADRLRESVKQRLCDAAARRTADATGLIDVATRFLAEGLDSPAPRELERSYEARDAARPRH
jgi:hypothetical protein